MFIAQRNAKYCVRCALRFHLRLLQQRRQKSDSSHHETSEPPRRFRLDRSSTIRPLNGDRRAGRDRGSDDRGFVRRYLAGDGVPNGPARGKRPPQEHDFREALTLRISAVREQVKEAPLLQRLVNDQENATGQFNFEPLWNKFTQQLLQATSDRLPFVGKVETKDIESAAVDALRRTFARGGIKGLDDKIKYAFYGFVTNARFSPSDIANQKAMADLRYPTEWFPATRVIHRTIHVHVGPTNSGKTYQALKRLEQAENGVYGGPLRLLAHEVYSRMNAMGKPCALVTGEERRFPVGADETSEWGLSACTVEMIPLNVTFDVAVIDEIQMIGNAERGWAWTQALLGVKAREVHLCGEERTVPLIRELCASTGDKVEVHRYERLSPLQMADSSLDGNLKQLKKGDCIVSFSVMGIHALRKQVEETTGKKVATVYGSLPPETRAQQARLFNEPNNEYDYLIASDAIGMGLNLAIKRVIFESSSKFDGIQQRTLSVADIKQIGGRAGRFRVAPQATQIPATDQDLTVATGSAVDDIGQLATTQDESLGLVTTLERFDFPIIRQAMTAQPDPIKSAGILPPAPVLERFATYFPPGTPFSYILIRLHELAQTHTRFHLCGLQDQLWIADIIEPVEGLSVTDRIIICSAPVARGDAELWATLLPAYGQCIATQSGGSIVDIKELPIETLELPVSADRLYLRKLERLHKGIVAYLWLSYRFAGVFSTRSLAVHLKGLVEAKIEEVLSKLSFSQARRQQIANARKQRILTEFFFDKDGNVIRDDTADTVTHRESTIEIPEVRRDGDKASEQGQTYTEPTIGEELDGFDAQINLSEQTSLIAGGDHFGGEENLGVDESATAEADNGRPSKQEGVDDLLLSPEITPKPFEAGPIHEMPPSDAINSKSLHTDLEKDMSKRQQATG